MSEDGALSGGVRTREMNAASEWAWPPLISSPLLFLSLQRKTTTREGTDGSDAVLLHEPSLIILVFKKKQGLV